MSFNLLHLENKDKLNHDLFQPTFSLKWFFKYVSNVLEYPEIKIIISKNIFRKIVIKTIKNKILLLF